MILAGLALIIVGYLLGAIPFGLLVSRAMGGPDPRQGGSGNIGATNVARQAGKSAGVLTLLLDIGKGLGPALLADYWLTPWWAGAVGLAAFVGHCWPVYLSFRGGKGVATFLGVLLGLAPIAGLATGLVVILLAIFSKHMSLGSMVGCGSSVGWLWVAEAPLAFMVMAAVMTLLVMYKHRENIDRLRAGQEHVWR